MIRPVLGLLLAALLAVPAVGHAATVEVSGGQLQISGAGAEANNLTITQTGPTTATVTDTGADPSTASCADDGVATITCTVNPSAGISVFLGDGDDILQGVNWTSCPAFPGECMFVSAGDGRDIVGGSPGRDIQYGDAGNDDLYGEGGRDNQTGGPGADYFDGGADFDTAYYSTLEPGRTAGITVTLDDVGNDGDLTYDSNGIHTDNVLATIEQVVGTQYPDTLTGTDGVQRLDGGGGGDTITGGPGADHLYGEDGDDTINAQDGGAETAVHCGPGTDTANLDEADTSTECETVNRPSAGGGGGTGGGGSGGGGSGGTGGTGGTGGAGGGTTQAAPASVLRMPNLRPVKRAKKKNGQVYSYTAFKKVEAELKKAGLCTTVGRSCPPGNVHVTLDLKAKAPGSVLEKYRGDAKANDVYTQKPVPDKELSPGQRISFSYVDPTFKDPDKKCEVTDSGDNLHLKVAAFTFEETAKYLTDRDCKQVRDWKVVKRETVPTLVKTSIISGVKRIEKDDASFYELSVKDRKSVPPCTFAQSTEALVLDTFRVQGVKTAAEALALMAQQQCEAVVAATTTTENASDPVVSKVKKVETKSPYGDTVRFDLTINQYVPKRNAGEPPRQGDPVLPKSDFCASSVTFGPLSFEGACLKREGFTWVSTGEVRVNGLKIVPNGAAAKIVLDPLNLRVAATGEASVVLDGTLFGRRVGPVTFYEGRFDWVFQYKPDLAGLAGVIMPPAGNGGRGLSLPEIQKLPGLGGSLPNLGGLRIPDFSALSREQLEALATKVPKIDFPKVEIPSAVIPSFDLPEIGFTVPPGVGDFLGFPLTGEVKAKLETRNGVRGANVKVNLALPAVFQGVSGSAGFFVGSDGTLLTDAVGLAAPELWLGPIKLAPVNISYDGPSDTWKGGTTVFLPVPGSPGVGGSFLVQQGQLKQVGVNLAGQLPVGPIVLERFDGLLNLDPLRVTGTLGGSVGPSIPGAGPIVRLNSTFDFDADRFKIKGDVKVAGVALGDALVEYHTNGYFHARGRLNYHLDAAKEYGFGGEVDGWATKTAFNVEGNVKFKAKGRELSGEAVVSSVGVAGCATIKGVLWTNVELGAGYKWGTRSIDWIGGTCDLGPYSASRTRTALRQAGARVVTLPAGLDVASIAVEGAGAPPLVTITGPKGEKVTAPADGNGVQDDRFFLVQQPANNMTYVAIAKPSAGAWTVTTEAASAPIAKVVSAEALPDPKVTARVSGSGAKRKLTYTVKAIPGQAVRFAEEGGDVAADLGVAKGARGSLSFRPAAGAAGTRRIVAIVEQGGLVRTTLAVARYRAPSAQLAAPRVRAVRKGGSVAVSWTSVAGAKGYRLTTKLNGRTVFTTVKAAARKASVPGLLPTSGATVAVQALGEANALGRPGRAAVKRPKVRKRGR